MPHTFHIPVLGLGFSIDTPLKTARYGIASVVSIVDDELIERMRKYHALQNEEAYTPIMKSAPDARAKRITAYLNLLNKLVNKQFERLKTLPFNQNNDLDRYFSLLPDSSHLKQGYELMQEYPEGISKKIFQNILLSRMQKGAIDVNIMSKVDKLNFDIDGQYTGDDNTDALAGIRGFVNSDLQSSVVLSAGMNPRLYSYLESFDCFFPDSDGALNKKIILKVSDYRSAYIQAKFLAKKGLWVSEFRIESGLNCGGHAFATEGLLLGPILEEFKQKRETMMAELLTIYQAALIEKGANATAIPPQRISVQGGIGTANENDFLLEHYQLQATGWGSPFLLVPEATNVDEETLQQLTSARQEDFYLSASSPLGILFNNFKKSTGEQQRLERIEQGRPGSPCVKKYLCTNTEFTEQPICTASREYQHLKLQQLQTLELSQADYQERVENITEKVCLCEGLCASAYLKNDMLKPRENAAVTICPGPNLAYFSQVYTLDEMVGHIYGRQDLLSDVERPSLFINELNLYLDYFRKEITGYLKNVNQKKEKQLVNFKDQLQQGIIYYKQLLPQLYNETISYRDEMYKNLIVCEAHLKAIGAGLLAV
ncbi:hypothetical protein [Mucilaginibacter polytrichastri]|uniref:Uncharacterized protein n=1 Tax=Mucilaginibacter polytrichastri TaxID=1302689 RepID=A0A1Q6A0H8_9SPHI|nr:hypothetical protein [Mucilaginibacter polytrichastri]OKS87520.1 hypothetical protein RG47T_2981 [Mucilaginibacter polytrichastri]SFS91648.1 hypothetical protein SAMN04487890_106115 [Mucilaginibacter polytrichastri]